MNQRDLAIAVEAILATPAEENAGALTLRVPYKRGAGPSRATILSALSESSWESLADLRESYADYKTVACYVSAACVAADEDCYSYPCLVNARTGEASPPAGEQRLPKPSHALSLAGAVVVDQNLNPSDLATEAAEIISDGGYRVRVHLD